MKSIYYFKSGIVKEIIVASRSILYGVPPDHKEYRHPFYKIYIPYPLPFVHYNILPTKVAIPSQRPFKKIIRTEKIPYGLYCDITIVICF